MNKNNNLENNETKKYPWTAKRIAAIVGIVLLVLLYVVMLIRVIFMDANAGDSFIMMAAGTVGIPICIWLFIWIFGAFTGRHTVASLDAMTSDMDHDEKGNAIPREPSGEIKTVIFDIGNVLVDFCWDKMYKDKLGCSDETIERLGKATVYSKEWKEFDRGVLSYGEIVDSLVALDPELETEIRTALENQTGIVSERDYADKWVLALKKAHYKVLLLSNFSMEAYDTNLAHFKFMKDVDGGILSFRDHMIKPDREIYQLITDRYELKPSECVFIDDTAENIEAAKAFGMHGIVFGTLDQVLEDLDKLGVKD